MVNSLVTHRFLYAYLRLSWKEIHFVLAFICSWEVRLNIIFWSLLLYGFLVAWLWCNDSLDLGIWKGLKIYIANYILLLIVWPEIILIVILSPVNLVFHWGLNFFFTIPILIYSFSVSIDYIWRCVDISHTWPMHFKMRWSWWIVWSVLRYGWGNRRWYHWWLISLFMGVRGWMNVRIMSCKSWWSVDRLIWWDIIPLIPTWWRSYMSYWHLRGYTWWVSKRWTTF